eukprot:751415-Hanusia_phi.AAC.3
MLELVSEVTLRTEASEYWYPNLPTLVSHLGSKDQDGFSSFRATHVRQLRERCVLTITNAIVRGENAVSVEILQEILILRVKIVGHTPQLVRVARTQTAEEVDEDQVRGNGNWHCLLIVEQAAEPVHVIGFRVNCRSNKILFTDKTTIVYVGVQGGDYARVHLDVTSEGL